MPITFGSIKDYLAVVVEGGVSASDPRVIPIVNAAMVELARAVPRGVFVGSTTSAIVSIDPNTKLFSLPATMDVVHAIEGLQDTGLPNGWVNLTSANTMMDPDDMLDTAFVDQGVNVATGLRSYMVPECAAGITQLLVHGLLAFVPVVDDTTVLYVQNIEALKLWILSIFKGTRSEDPDVAKKYEMLAVEKLTSELARHLDDPQRYAARMAHWRQDVSAYADGTLANIAARMALDFSNGQKLGRIKLYRMVNEAAREAVNLYNSLGKQERYTNANGPTQLTYTLAVNPGDPLSYPDYEVLTHLVKAQAPTLKPEEAATGKQAATEVIERNLATMIDAARSTARYARIAADDYTTIGFLTAKMGLEIPTAPMALTYSDNQLRRWINEAARQAVQDYNFLGRTERYSNANGPNSMAFAFALTDAAQVSYFDYEVLSLLVRAQIAETSGAASDAARTAARGLVERNLGLAVDQARNVARYARLGNGQTTLGYLTARLGLECPSAELALASSDNQLRRWVNEAAREALQQRNFLTRSERYSNLAGPDPTVFVYAATDDAVVSYPDLEVLRRYVTAQMQADPATSRALRAEAEALVERNLQKSIEASRNSKWQCLLDSNPFPQFGGARAQIGLEYGGDGGADGYKLSDFYVSRVTQQAWAQAATQYNFFSRQEDYEATELTLPAFVPGDADQIPFSLEVLKLYAEAQLCQDKNEEQRANSYKEQAAAAVQRDLKAGIETTRRTTWEGLLTTNPFPQFGGARAHLGLELAGDTGGDAYALSDPYAARLTQQAWRQAADQYNFLVRGEDYAQTLLTAPLTNPADTDTIPFSLNIIKGLAEAQYHQDRNKLDLAGALKQGAFDLIKRDLEQVVEFNRRTAWQQAVATNPYPQFGGAVAQLGLEFLDMGQYSAAKVSRWVTQAAQMAIDQFNFLSRTEDYEQVALALNTPVSDPTTVIPFALEVIKLLTESLVYQDTKNLDGASTCKKAAFDLIERNLQQLVERARRAAWESALTATPYPQFGGAVAQLGLEYTDGLGAAAAKMARWVQQAWSMAADQYNFLARRESYQTATITLPVPVVQTSVIPFPVEVIKLLTESLMCQDAKNAEEAAALKSRALDLIERNLHEQIETARRTVWLALTVSNPFPQFGGARAQFALELAGDTDGDAYALSDAYAARLTQQAWRQAADQYNFLSRDESYQEMLLTAPGSNPADTDVIPSGLSLDVIKLLAESQYNLDRNKSEQAAALKAQAQGLIERDLHAAIERARYNVCEAQTLMAQNTFGYVAGRLGLDMPDGLTMSDAMRKRLVNEAEELLADSGRWKFMEGEYYLATDELGIIVLPPDVENVIYAEWCGEKLELKSRKWLYSGWAVRCGEGAWEGWAFRNNLPLYYAGHDASGNAQYNLASASPCGGVGPFRIIRSLCRRKWVLKVADTDLMLVDSYPAIKRAVTSILAGQKGDVPTASMQFNGALKALDNQLGVELEGQVPQISVKMPGLPQHGGGRRYGGWGRRY